MSDLIIEGASGIPDGLYMKEDGLLFKYKPNGGTVYTARAYHITEMSLPKWIPVTEQKPHCWCLVTDVHRNVPFVAREIVTVGEDCIDGETLNTLNIDLFTGEKLPIEDLKKIIHGNRIIAWMPLPEPYKGGED